MSEADEVAAAPRRSMQFRKRGERLEPSKAKRQGEITLLAFQMLGKDSAIAFLNTEHSDLGGRPLDLATSSDQGRDIVEAQLRRMAPQDPQ